MQKLKILIGTMRLPFVILAPACALVGLGTATWTIGQINWFYFSLALIGAIASHISVNVFNEYFDFRTGLDARTQRTPFSGGSGTLQAHPEIAPQALALAWSAFGVAALVGITFTVVWGWGTLPIWITGLFLLYSYTIWIVKFPLLCLIVPGLGFGPLMVLSTHFALTGKYSVQAFVASLVPFFLVSNLLLLNQFPDVEADRSIGRSHYPIVMGRRVSGFIYIAFLIAAYLVISLGVLFGYLPRFALLALLTLVLAIQIIRNVLKNSEDIPALIPAMGQNVLINLATPILLAIGLMIG
ncbi:MAG: ubiquinone biosynthesis protein UbiA [Chloroflexi bacterium RBG_16_51_16]|nr:MAG: ubiquinone biosynthesis protein UbiA [Chloroflexi bacterium RBG_16_51_16]